MTRTGFVLANLFHKKTRTVLTLGCIVFAFLLFGLLDSVRVAFTSGGGVAGADRLVVSSRLSLTQMLWIAAVGHLGIGVASLHMNAAPFYVMLFLFALGDPWNWTQAFGALIVGAGVLIAQSSRPAPVTA